MESVYYKHYEECATQAETHPEGSFTFICDNGSDDPPLCTAYPGTDHNPWTAGFGGRIFRFVKPDGTVFESNNVWHRGNLSRIPKSLVRKFDTWKKA